jgi:hypothetical protein
LQRKQKTYRIREVLISEQTFEKRKETRNVTTVKGEGSKTVFARTVGGACSGKTYAVKVNSITLSKTIFTKPA